APGSGRGRLRATRCGRRAHHRDAGHCPARAVVHRRVAPGPRAIRMAVPEAARPRERWQCLIELFLGGPCGRYFVPSKIKNGNDEQVYYCDCHHLNPPVKSRREPIIEPRRQVRIWEKTPMKVRSTAFICEGFVERPSH